MERETTVYVSHTERSLKIWLVKRIKLVTSHSNNENWQNCDMTKQIETVFSMKKMYENISYFFLVVELVEIDEIDILTYLSFWAQEK